MSLLYILASFWLFFLGLCLLSFFYKPCLVMGSSLSLEYSLNWVGGLETCFSLILDGISLMFGLSVLLISSSVLMFCCFYMVGEKHPKRFCYLVLLFVFFMSLFILMPSGYVMMVGWDGLGVVSFLLVAYDKSGESISAALVTAFVNRVGDALLILFLAFSLCKMSFRTFDFFYIDFYVVGWLTMMVASMTKSAQAPFSSWLPAAMAAPTPVSALVHSSTLVTAGVYILCRFVDYMQGVWFVMMSLISVLTLVMAGLTAVVESDLKKVVAYSTLSQLGMMMLALSLNDKYVCIFHLINHAYFKALMFLCVGSIIFMNCGAQDARLISGLWYKMPVVFSYLVVCCFSLVGVPFMSGWYSKEKIIDICSNSQVSFFVVVLLFFSLILTGFYSFSLLSKLCLGFSFGSSLEKIMDSNVFLLSSTSMLIFGAVFSGYLIDKSFLSIYCFCPINSFYKFLTLMCVFLGCFTPFFFQYYFMTCKWSPLLKFSMGKKFLSFCFMELFFLPSILSFMGVMFCLFSSKLMSQLEKGFIGSLSEQMGSVVYKTGKDYIGKVLAWVSFFVWGLVVVFICMVVGLPFMLMYLKS